MTKKSKLEKIVNGAAIGLTLLTVSSGIYSIESFGDIMHNKKLYAPATMLVSYLLANLAIGYSMDMSNKRDSENE